MSDGHWLKKQEAGDMMQLGEDATPTHECMGGHNTHGCQILSQIRGYTLTIRTVQKQVDYV